MSSTNLLKQFKELRETFITKDILKATVEQTDEGIPRVRSRGAQCHPLDTWVVHQPGSSLNSVFLGVFLIKSLTICNQFNPDWGGGAVSSNFPITWLVPLATNPFYPMVIYELSKKQLH
jgi:hypothetical protein